MLVLDANILMRAVLGRQARALLAKYGGRIEFVAPDVAFEEARKHLPEVIERRKLEAEPFLDYFDSLANVVQIVECETYSGFEAIARERLMRRDENDWPILAAALALRCPIWTEDTDFFGCGVATWTTDRVELHLSEVSS
jgi:predicted nucleic acid-binding protein